MMDATFFFIFSIALGYGVVRAWRRKRASVAANGENRFRPKIGFTRLDGMVSLSLLLENESHEHVWAEETEIFLSGLNAQDQATEASLHGIQKIRQMVRSGDMLPISLCEVIYEAAGNPQRKYSCVMSSVLRYRIGEERFEKNMETYKLRMAGLTVSSIHRERKLVPPFQKKESQDVPAATATPK